MRPDRSASVRRATAVVALATMLAVSCSRSSEPAAKSTAPPKSFAGTTRPLSTAKTCRPTEPVPPTNELQHLSFGGKERTYVLSVPKGYDGTVEAPVIFDFYGRIGDAQEQVADFELDDEATAAGMLVVTPQAAEDRDPDKNAWAADVPLVQAILQTLRDRWCIDDDAIFTAGFSDGGVFSAYLACELPTLFAAVGTVAEVDYPPNCPPEADLSVIGFHGKSDPLVPYTGGATDDGDGRSGLPGSEGSLPPSEAIERTFGRFATLAGCQRKPARTQTTPDVEHLVYDGCRPGLGVELYAVADGGHEWPGDPGAEPAAPGTINANHLMVEFFLAHMR